MTAAISTGWVLMGAAGEYSTRFGFNSTRFPLTDGAHQLKALLDDLWCPFVAITPEDRDMGASRPTVRDVRRLGLTDARPAVAANAAATQLANDDSSGRAS